MNYEMQAIAKIASSAQFNIDLGQLSKITKNRLIKAFQEGYLTMTSGDAAMFHKLISDHVDIPIMQFSKKDQYWNCLIIRNMMDEGKPLLSDWWKTDRVVYRLENPENWNQFSTQEYYVKSYTVEPDWNKSTDVRILSDKSIDKNIDKFKMIAESYIKTEKYQQKKEEVLEMIKQKHIITYNCKL